METEILQKVQQNYGRWQEMRGSHSEGHWQDTRGKFRSYSRRYILLLAHKVTEVIPYVFNSFFNTVT